MSFSSLSTEGTVVGDSSVDVLNPQYLFLIFDPLGGFYCVLGYSFLDLILKCYYCGPWPDSFGCPSSLMWQCFLTSRGCICISLFQFSADEDYLHVFWLVFKCMDDLSAAPTVVMFTWTSGPHQRPVQL